MEVVFGKEKIALKGNEIKLGDKADNFTVLDNNLQEKTLDDYPSKFIVISVVPSIDTNVCEYQTKMFNKKLADFKKVTVLTISNDLPFAQKRWCGNAGLDSIITLSDYRDLDFAMKYGTLIENHRLQTRAVFVLDENRTIIYKEYVSNVSEHPSYEEVVKLIEEMY